MASTLQSCQISETTDNHTQREPSTNRSTLSAVKTSISDIINDNDEYIDADNSDNTIKDLETITAHNQKVIDCQQLQLQCVQQKVEYKNN